MRVVEDSSIKVDPFRWDPKLLDATLQKLWQSGKWHVIKMNVRNWREAQALRRRWDRRGYSLRVRTLPQGDEIGIRIVQRYRGARPGNNNRGNL